MQMSKGVEWTVHALALMAALPQEAGLSAEALARFHGVSAAYMAKQLQAASKAGLVEASRGARGGYRLARPPAEINLWQITSAIEGVRPAFRCTEIRQNGPCGAPARDCKTPCPIASAFYAAETAWRKSLEAVTLADIGARVMAGTSPKRLTDLFNWIGTETGGV